MKEYIPTHSTRSALLWYQNSDYNLKKKVYRSKSLTNMLANILNKMLSNWSQQDRKSIIHHDQIEFIPWMKDWLNIGKWIDVTQPISKLFKKLVKKKSIVKKKSTCSANWKWSFLSQILVIQKNLLLILFLMMKDWMFFS